MLTTLKNIPDILFYAPFQGYINISDTGLKAYQTELINHLSSAKFINLKLPSIKLINKGILSPDNYGFAKVHPQLQFQLNKDLQKDTVLRNQILHAFGQYYEGYAKEIFQLLLESKKDNLFNLGLEYMTREFNNFQKAIYCQIYHKHPPFFIFACLITFAENQHFLLNLIDTLEDILNRWQECLPEYPEKLQLHFAGTVINELAKMYSKNGQKEKAIKVLQKGLVIFQELEDKNGESHILHTLGNQYNALQDKEKAISYFEQAANLYRSINKKTKAAEIALNIGEIYRERRHFDKAIRLINQAANIFQTNELNYNYAQALDSLGNIQIDLRNFEQAEQHFHQALALFQTRGHLTKIAEVQKNLGRLFFESGALDKCQQYFKYHIESLLQSPITVPSEIGSAYNKLGAISFQQKQFEEALFYWNKAKELSASPNSLATLNMNFGGLYATTQQYQKAIPFLKEALNWFESNDKSHTTGKIYQNLGICFSRLEDYFIARDYFEKAVQKYQLVEEPYHLIEVQEYLGYTYLETKQIDKAEISLLITIKGYIHYKRWNFLEHLLKNIGQMQNLLNLPKMVKQIAKIWGKTATEIWEIIDNNH